MRQLFTWMRRCSLLPQRVRGWADDRLFDLEQAQEKQA